MLVIHNAKDNNDQAKTGFDVFLTQYKTKEGKEIIENMKKLLAWLLLNYCEIKSKDVASLAFTKLTDTMI